MTGEEIGREQKAKRLAREIIKETVRVVANEIEDQAIDWNALALRCGVGEPSGLTRKRVVELLSEIAL